MSQEKDNLNAWLDFVLASHPESTIELGLARMKTMLSRMTITFDCPVITVAGTNGKGSTCAMLESIYKAAGYKTAKHTSPHMLRFNERACINGVDVDDATLVEGFKAVEAVRDGLGLTYFEYTALAILKVFQLAKPDVVILEIGLGGRLDAINALESTASIVTTVGIDHEAYLGNTRDSIGWEKAHIYRAGKPAVCADRHPPEKLLQYAKALGTNLYVYGQDFDIKEVTKDEWQFVFGKEIWPVCPPALAGVNQKDNAAGVLALVYLLQDKLPVAPEAIIEGLKTVKLKARFETISKDPTIILDVGHNPHAAAVLAQNVEKLPSTGKLVAVFGMLADKDMIDVIKLMNPHVDEWFISGLPKPRGADCELLHRTMLEAGVDHSKIKRFETIESAFDAARQEASITDKILVFGSFVTVTAVLAKLA